MFNKSSLYLIILLAFLLRSAVIFFYFEDHKFYGYEYGTHDTHFPIGDDQRYIEIAMNFISGHGFPVIYETPPYSHDYRRGPLYLLFLASIFKIFGFNILILCLFQALISAWSIYFIYKIADYYFGNRTALIASLIWAVYPAIILWTMAIYRETLTVFLLLWTTWRVIKLTEQQNWLNAIYAGITISLILLLDPFTQVLVPVYLIFLWLAPDFHYPANRPILTFAKVFFTDMRKKLFLSGVISVTAVILMLPWLLYSKSMIGRPVLATAGEYGIAGNYFQYFGFQIEKRKNKDLSDLEYSRMVTDKRFLIACKYLGLNESLGGNLTTAQKNELLNLLKGNPDFMSTLNSYHFNQAVGYVIEYPDLYFGQPFGKLILVKFFGYWMNIVVNYQEKPHPNISTLYLITNTHNFFIKALGILGLIVSLFLFFIYVRNAYRAKLLFFLWLPYFLFFNIFVFRSEPRYVLPVLAFNIIILAEALRAMLDSNKKTSAGTGIKFVQE